MIGEKWGRLTVEEFSHKDDKHRKWWRCRCECGGSAVLHTGNLRSGNTQSCGCLLRDAKKAQRLPGNAGEITAVILGYKRHAERRSHEWSLPRNFVVDIIARPCFYCGAAPSNKKVTKNSIEGLRYNGIDRINNKLGYTQGNVVPCCRICNRAKETLTVDEFAEWVKRISAMADQWGSVFRLRATA